eukprot:3035922-Rhodomonas_salina.1
MPVVVKTDHDSLHYINSQPNLTGRLARWFEFFAEYNITEIHHIPGKDNVVADALLRRPDYAKVAVLFAMTPLHTGCMIPHSNTFQSILAAQLKDLLCQQLRRELEDPKTKPDSQLRARYSIADNGALVWTSKGRQRVIVPPAFRRTLLSEAHESKIAAAGHHGVDKTYCALAEGYYWPRMWDDVHRFVTTCVSCQTNKPDNQLPAGQA